MPARVREVGDLWAGLRQSKGTDLRALTEKRRTHADGRTARR
jgi:hypothetical protein